MKAFLVDGPFTQLNADNLFVESQLTQEIDCKSFFKKSKKQVTLSPKATVILLPLFTLI